MSGKRNPDIGPSRRDVLAVGAGLGAMAVVGCGDSGGSNDGGGPSVDSDVPDLGEIEVGAALWQTMSAYVRASADGSIGTRFNLYNPATVPQRVVIQVLTKNGQLVAKDSTMDALAPEASTHIELGAFLTEHQVPLPFEGSVWIGTTPQSGQVFMGLQGITFDWYGPAHLATVHGMRDFGNSNHDNVWSDLILPKVTVGPRFVSKVAVLNGSGDGVSEALIAKPELIIRDDEGVELIRTVLDDIQPYCLALVDIGELLGGAPLAAGSIQIREPFAGLVATGFICDTENDGFVNADHFFDRHFVVDATGFTG